MPPFTPDDEARMAASVTDPAEAAALYEALALAENPTPDSHGRSPTAELAGLYAQLVTALLLARDVEALMAAEANAETWADNERAYTLREDVGRRLGLLAALYEACPVDRSTLVRLAHLLHDAHGPHDPI